MGEGLVLWGPRARASFNLWIWFRVPAIRGQTDIYFELVNRYVALIITLTFYTLLCEFSPASAFIARSPDHHRLVNVTFFLLLWKFGTITAFFLDWIVPVWERRALYFSYVYIYIFFFLCVWANPQSSEQQGQTEGHATAQALASPGCFILRNRSRGKNKNTRSCVMQESDTETTLQG